MSIMLSTEVCRLIIRDKPMPLLQQLQNWTSNGEELVISAVTYGELMAGALLTQDRNRHIQLVSEFCGRLNDILAWDRDAVERFAHIQLESLQQGKSVNMNDSMVAAHALSRNIQLLIREDHRLSSVNGLNLLYWMDDKVMTLD